MRWFPLPPVAPELLKPLVEPPQPIIKNSNLVVENVEPGTQRMDIENGLQSQPEGGRVAMANHGFMPLTLSMPREWEAGRLPGPGCYTVTSII